MAEQSFQGKTVLVTGSSSGIGREIALKFAHQGAAVILTCHKHRQQGEEVLQLIRDTGVKAMLYQLDMSDAQQVENMVSLALADFEGIDILVNNAGASGFMGPVWETPVEEWDRTIRINLSGAFYLSRLVVPVMIKKSWGRIINITSIGYRRILPNMASYLVSKAALNTFTKALSKEAGPYGITVNAIAPGQVTTERIIRERLPGLSKQLGISEQQIQEDMLKDSDTKKFTTVEDVAELVLSLSSVKAGNLTGVVIDLAGGM